jgi:hypothetical protein
MANAARIRLSGGAGRQLSQRMLGQPTLTRVARILGLSGGRSRAEEASRRKGRSDALYNTAMGHNRGLDRDKDGIACEKL